MFAELLARTCFSFLRGASQPEEHVLAAKERGLDAIAIADRMGLYGSVRAHAQARESDMRCITGAELVLDPEELGRVEPRRKKTQTANEARLLALSDAPSVVLLAQDHEGYSNLCRLLTLSHADQLKKEGALRLEWLARHHSGLIAIVPSPRDPDGPDAAPDALLSTLCDVFADRAFLATHRHLDVFDRARLLRVAEQSARFELPVVASGRPLFHHRSRKPLADVLCCIREGITLDRAGTALDSNGEAFLRSELEMQKLFREHLDWVERTAEVASACHFSLAELRYHFPCELAPGETADDKLRCLTEEGIVRRYPNGIPPSVRAQIEKELVLIAQLSVAPYFLSTWEVVEIAREKKILCQGRGSAANSAVCYALGITAVDPARSNLLFERFMSAERSEPPDIDIDFEHERREEVIQELYARHGRDRAAMVSEVICYRGKSALRETGKAFGLSLEQIDRLSNTITHWDSAEVSDSRLVEMGFDPTDIRLRQSVTLARTLEGFPRHISIHVGGFVLSARPLHEVAPVEPARMPDRTVIPWDKDDIETLGFFKIDVLGLGMLTAIRKCLELIHKDGALHAPHITNEIETSCPPSSVLLVASLLRAAGPPRPFGRHEARQIGRSEAASGGDTRGCFRQSATARSAIECSAIGEVTRAGAGRSQVGRDCEVSRVGTGATRKNLARDDERFAISEFTRAGAGCDLRDSRDCPYLVGTNPTGTEPPFCDSRDCPYPVGTNLTDTETPFCDSRDCPYPVGTNPTGTEMLSARGSTPVAADSASEECTSAGGDANAGAGCDLANATNRVVVAASDFHAVKHSPGVGVRALNWAPPRGGELSPHHGARSAEREHDVWGGPAERRARSGQAPTRGGNSCSTNDQDVMARACARMGYVTVQRERWEWGELRAATRGVVESRFVESERSRDTLDVAEGFELIVRKVRAGNDVELMLQAESGEEAFDPLDVITRIPPEDPAVYDMACRADTVGVFQIESRAQMSMLPRLKPRNFYDLVVEVAIVRPGPIQGGMVHPYLRRRNGEEEITSPHPDLWPILERTLGVPLFQEQVMQISITGAGYTGGEADQLRRDMAAWKKSGKLLRHKSRLLEGFAKKGISAEFGEALFEQIKGFGDYGFPESHASSFALLVYTSTWQKAHYPAHFACALINSQPMGFYSPSTILQDAQRHGVAVLDVDVSKSDWDCTLEGGALRIGFRLVKGFSEKAARRVEEARREAEFTSLDDLSRRARLHKDELEMLGEAGALEPLVRGRRNALWQARAPRVGGLFEKTEVAEPSVELPPLRAAEQLLLDYGRKGLCVGDHPMRHLRPGLTERGVLNAKELLTAKQGRRVEVAGLVICRQQPGTASGVVFITLEDEAGFVNLVLWNRVYERLRLVARHSTLLLAKGVIERQTEEVNEPIVHVIVDDLERLDVPGKQLSSRSRDFH